MILYMSQQSDASKKGIEAIKRKKAQRILDYNENPSICKNCGNPLDYNHRHNKFCCCSCATSYNNKLRNPRSDESLRKTRDSLKSHYDVVGRTSSCTVNGTRVRYFDCKCEQCGKEFKSYKPNTRFCCSKCVGLNVSVKQKIREKVLERIKNGTHNGWQSRREHSYPEKFWSRVLEINFINYVQEDFSTKKYFLDFLIIRNGKKIDLEIDGSQHKNQQEHDAERDRYLTNLGYIVYRIKWNEINSEIGKIVMKSKIDEFLNFYNNL